MQIVTNEQIYDRWEQVPEALKEAFFSTDNGEIVWKACEDAGLPEEVIENVLVVMGNILLGFTHVNDLAKELQSIPDMDQKAIDPIIFQIDKRVFDPVKAEILKLYATVAGDQPSIVAQEAPAPTKGADIAKATMQIGEAPAMISTEHGPVTVAPTSEIPLEIRKVRIGGEIHAEAAVPAPIGGTPEIVPAPIAAPAIIHSEAELVPVAQKKRPLSSFGGMFGFRPGGAAKRSEPAVAAQVSMIEGLGRKPEDVARTAQQPVKVVHYTSAKAPEDMFAQSSVSQGQATPAPTPFVPVTKQEHPVDFEPKVVDLAQITPAPQVPAVTAPVPPMPEENRPIASMPKIPEAMIMKTPQRVEVVAQQAPQPKEPQLAEIPVRDDIVDLRMLERVDQASQK